MELDPVLQILDLHEPRCILVIYVEFILQYGHPGLLIAGQNYDVQVRRPGREFARPILDRGQGYDYQMRFGYVLLPVRKQFRY